MDEVEKSSKPKKDDAPKVSIVQVATATEDMIRLPDGSIVSQLEMLARIYVELQAIKKGVGVA